MASSIHAFPTTHDVDIKKFKFSPAEISISIGDTIRWVNKEKRQYHSVWFEQLGEKEPDYFFPGESYEKIFNKVGDFPYRCGPHPKMIGMVHVAENTATQVTASKKEVVSANTAQEISEPRKKEILYLLKHDCGSCHGMTLQGGLGPSLKPNALARMTEEQVALSITLGRPGTPMPPWKPFFTEHETLWLAQRLKQGIEGDKK